MVGVELGAYFWLALLEQMAELELRVPSDAAAPAAVAVAAAASETAITGHSDTLADLRNGAAAEVIRAAIRPLIAEAILKSVDSATVTNSKAVLKAGLAAAATVNSLKLGVPGAKKLELVLSLLKDAVEGLDCDPDSKAKLADFADSSLPVAIDGLLYGLRTIDAVPAVKAARALCCA